MTRLKKELTKRNIIWENDEEIIMNGPEYDTCSYLVDITDKFIITVQYSAVVDPTFSIYDRKNFTLLAEQSVLPYYSFANAETHRCTRTWGSYVYSWA